MANGFTHLETCLSALDEMPKLFAALANSLPTEAAVNTETPPA